MSIGDALKFEKSWIGDIWKGIKKDPKRLVLGVDPLSTKAWNAVLGRKDKPIVGDFGGPTKESYQNANAKGISTGTASTMHGIAKAIAGTYGAYGAAGGLGNAAGIGSTGGATAGTTGSTVGAGGTGAIGAGAAGGAAEAIPEVVISGSTGSGLGTAGAVGAGAGAGGATASSSNGNSWRDQMQQMPGQQQDNGQAAQAAEQRRQMEAMIEQERLRRESFRRNAIARSMLS